MFYQCFGIFFVKMIIGKCQTKCHLLKIDVLCKVFASFFNLFTCDVSIDIHMIVKLNQTGRSVHGLSKEYDISESTIYKWKNLYVLNPSTRLTGKEAAELRKENVSLKEELEILKKVAAIFSRKT